MSAPQKHSLTDPDSVRCLLGSILIALGSGTVYCYSYYNSQLFANCAIPLDQISKLSLSLSIGSSLLGLVVGPLIDKFGCNRMSYFGGLETFLGYFLLLRNYKLKSECSILSICAALIMIGMGSICGFYSCVKCVTYNFPHSRGLAGSIPVSSYALSSLLFSTFFKVYVKSNIEMVFKIFMFSCSLMICVGGYLIFLRDYEKLEHEDNNSVEVSSSLKADDMNLQSRETDLVASITKPISIKKKARNQSFTKDLQGSLKFWGLGGVRETPDSVADQPNIPLLFRGDYRKNSISFNDLSQSSRRDSNMSLRIDKDGSPTASLNGKQTLNVTSSNGRDNDVSVFALEDANHESIISDLNRRNSSLIPTKTSLIQHSSTKDLPIYATLTNWKFIGYYTVLALLQGIGQTYIYSVGFIVQLIMADSETDAPVDTAAIQSVQVSLIAVFSFAGRLLSGPLSDRLVLKKAQRKWNIIAACWLMILASIILTHFKSDNLATKIKWLNLCSCVFAFGFGITFGTYPAIIVDAFGTDLFSSIWGIITTGGLLTVKLFSKILSSDLEKDYCTDLGNRCIAKTFNVTSYCSLVAMAISGLMIIV